MAMKDTVEVDPNKFTWNCPNCEVRNYAKPTILDTPFGEVTCRNCGLQFGVKKPKGNESL